MKNRVAVSLIAVSMLASSAAFAQSTTVPGPHEGGRAGADGGPYRQGQYLRSSVRGELHGVCGRLRPTIQSSVAASARPVQAAAASTTKSDRRAWRPGGQNCSISIAPVSAIVKSAVTSRF